MINAYLLLLLTSLLAATAQVLLKKVAVKLSFSDLITYPFPVRAYGILTLIFGMIILSAACYLFALREVELTVAYMFGSISYLFVALFSKVFLNEVITRLNLLGLMFITLGIVVIHI